MLSGTLPFGDAADLTKYEIYINITEKKLRFGKGFGSRSRGLLTCLLDKNPATRLSWDGIQVSLYKRVQFSTRFVSRTGGDRLGLRLLLAKPLCFASQQLWYNYFCRRKVRRNITTHRSHAYPPVNYSKISLKIQQSTLKHYDDGDALRSYTVCRVGLIGMQYTL